MTALTKFIISTILGLIRFQAPLESELTKKVTAPHMNNKISLTLIVSSESCENILKLSCF